MFIATEAKPKGPDTKYTEDIVFDISGTAVKISIPKGNSKQIPLPEGRFAKRINIYSPPTEYTHDMSDASMTSIGERLYDFNGFLGRNIGFMWLYINVYRIKDNNTNIFSPGNLKQQITLCMNYRCSSFNKDIKENWLRLEWDTQPHQNSVNDIVFFKYTSVKQGRPNHHYSTAILDDCYLEILFDYSTIRDVDAPWVQLARSLENNIMKSIQIKLSESSESSKRRPHEE